MAEKLEIEEVPDYGRRPLGRALAPVAPLAPDVESQLERVGHNFKFSLLLLDHLGNLHPISRSHAQELGTFASVSQVNGKVDNEGNRAFALVMVLPRGNFECINLDNPDAGKPRFSGKQLPRY